MQDVQRRPLQQGFAQRYATNNHNNRGAWRQWFARYGGPNDGGDPHDGYYDGIVELVMPAFWIKILQIKQNKVLEFSGVNQIVIWHYFLEKGNQNDKNLNSKYFLKLI